MTDRNYELFVAAYDDEDSATEDFAAMKDLDDATVVAAVVMTRDAQGKVEVKAEKRHLPDGVSRPVLIGHCRHSGPSCWVGCLAPRHAHTVSGSPP